MSEYILLNVLHNVLYGFPLPRPAQTMHSLTGRMERLLLHHKTQHPSSPGTFHTASPHLYHFSSIDWLTPWHYGGNLLCTSHLLFMCLYLSLPLGVLDWWRMHAGDRLWILLGCCLSLPMAMSTSWWSSIMPHDILRLSLSTRLRQKTSPENWCSCSAKLGSLRTCSWTNGPPSSPDTGRACIDGCTSNISRPWSTTLRPKASEWGSTRHSNICCKGW